MRRRDLLAGVAGAVASWPLATAAQQRERMRRVGVLIPWPENDAIAQASVSAFAEALASLGWAEGKNIRLDYRFAAADPTLFKRYAAELVGLSPDVILASSAPSLAALRQQTSTISIVFVLVPDPVGMGFVQSLVRPGGNITGFTLYDPPLMGKWLQLLKEVAPSVAHIAVIFNPDTTPYAPLFNRAIETAAPSFGVAITFAPVHDDAGIEEAIAAVAREPGGGVINLPESWSVTHRSVIIAAAARHGLPLMGGTELFPGLVG
jgi:putative tryptophan/tyrosine transport system substrate-binding protein